LQITIHQAKGLEFPTVFIPRFNEGTIPLDNRMSESGSEKAECHDAARHVQEERRLAFVALSRAKTQLFVSWVSKSRFGEPLLPSRFIEEIPSNLMTAAAAAPTDVHTVTFPQCHGPLGRTSMPPQPSTIRSSTTIPMVSAVANIAAPAQQGFMGAFRKASELLAEQASSIPASRMPNK
jgi:DNA helicase-2/ATP-dependent DNA helicase PcrA